MQELYDRTKRKFDGVSSSSGSQHKQQKHNGSHREDAKIPSSMERTRLDPRTSVSNSISPAQSRKIANLLKALDEALEVDGMGQTLDFIGEVAYSRCVDLRTSLSSARSKLDDGETISAASHQQRSHDFFNVPKTISPNAITPWKSSTIPLTLPPIPEVLNPTLKASAFVHTGCTNGNPYDLSYERLEWIGDAYIELIATLLISQTFPLDLPGRCSHYRETLVKNLTLADFACKYGFDKRLVLPDPKVFSVKPKDRTKILGDVFEAYVAAVILSDPVDGLIRASQWLKDLWSMTLAKEIVAEEHEQTKRKGVSPIWNTQGAGPVPDIKSKVPMTIGPKETLGHMICMGGVDVKYEDAGPERRENKLVLFTVGAYLYGYGEKRLLLGTGQGKSKKEAGARAAEMALKNEKLIKPFANKKKLLMAQRQLEQEAVDGQKGS
ncbi:related to Ribonuclease III [Rhynchosporium secalis]|uniref:Related to Ribonuclease III n=1 Tax=Rhynchosporium secalis TaxID=38038 RepID=A0A1E1MIJ5_RHYSE|nr:related to Ribonuclease III [Rhynchosporium secalis]